MFSVMLGFSGFVLLLSFPGISLDAIVRHAAHSVLRRP